MPKMRSEREETWGYFDEEDIKIGSQNMKDELEWYMKTYDINEDRYFIVIRENGKVEAWKCKAGKKIECKKDSLKNFAKKVI